MQPRIVARLEFGAARFATPAGEGPALSAREVSALAFRDCRSSLGGCQPACRNLARTALAAGTALVAPPHTVPEPFA